MTVPPEALYAALITSAMPRSAVLRRDDGHVMPLALERWLGPTCPVDEAIAGAAVGPVLDVGCGPGRLLDALTRCGKYALGVDLSPAAVAHARERGRRAVLASVFDDLPRAGLWGSALLLDGSVGIGGDAAALLDRVGALLAPGAQAIVEVEPPGAGTRAGRVRIEDGDIASDWFPWAHVDADGIAGLAEVSAVRCLEGRWFAWVA